MCRPTSLFTNHDDLGQPSCTKSSRRQTETIRVLLSLHATIACDQVSTDISGIAEVCTRNCTGVRRADTPVERGGADRTGCRIRQIAFLDVGEDVTHPRCCWWTIEVVVAGWKVVVACPHVAISKVVSSKTLLLQLVATRTTTSSFTSLLHGWQQKTNQYTDDRNNDQQFNEGEPSTSL